MADNGCTQVTSVLPPFCGVKRLDLCLLEGLDEEQLRFLGALRGLEKLHMRGSTFSNGRPDFLSSLLGLTAVEFEGARDSQLCELSVLTALRRLSWTGHIDGHPFGASLGVLRSCTRLQVCTPVP